MVTEFTTAPVDADRQRAELGDGRPGVTQPPDAELDPVVIRRASMRSPRAARAAARARRQGHLVERARLVEKHSGPGRFNVVTLVKWSSADDLASAREVIDGSHRAADFQPAEFFKRAGIEADLAKLC